MDRVDDHDQWQAAEESAHKELSRLFKKWRSTQPFGHVGVKVRSEGARGPQTIIPIEEPETKIR